jgi:predicted nucleic acid-binding protein
MKTDVVVDTSVWIDHFATSVPGLELLIQTKRARCHPMVLGEVTCGQLKDRRHALRWLGEIKPATIAAHEEVLAMVESLDLFGKGLGWIDAHLLASAMLSGTSLYTHDKALMAAASRLGLLHT